MLITGSYRTSTLHGLRHKSLLSIHKKTPKPKEGPCFKYSPALFQGWQARYLSVKDSTLRYFKIKGGKMQQMGVLNF